jgi:Cytochrome c554 and c-prime
MDGIRLCLFSLSVMNWFAGFLLASVAGFLSLSLPFGLLQVSPAVAQRPSAIESAKDPAAAYAGDSACTSCHAEKVQAFHLTSHYLTSRLPSKDSILGSFAAGANMMKTSNPYLAFRMHQNGGEFFQDAIEGESPYTTTRSERFDLVIGSGGKGQTYLFWKGDDLFELPVSFWRELGWVNSPGYRDGAANFRRPVIPRCLECHATYFESTPPPANHYSKTGYVVGITCEKCHGPGAEHARRFAGKSASAGGAGILNPARFSRERQMDLCAWCHAGVGTSLQPEFSYKPGEALDRFLRFTATDPSAPVDVHGSQSEMLERSRCFQKSGMTCLTCHDVHSVQHDTAEFSKRCLSCHKPESNMLPKSHRAGDDCIGCHMPLQETELIVFDQNGGKAKPKIRNHWIKIYEGNPPPAASTRN